MSHPRCNRWQCSRNAQQRPCGIKECLPQSTKQAIEDEEQIKQANSNTESNRFHNDATLHTYTKGLSKICGNCDKYYSLNVLKKVGCRASFIESNMNHQIQFQYKTANIYLTNCQFSPSLFLAHPLHLQLIIYDPQQILITQKQMERLLSVFEDCIRIIREGRNSDLSNYYDNETLPSRIKTIVRSIESLSQQMGGGGEEGMMLVALTKFKDDLSIGSFDGIQETLADASLPKILREAFREIYMLFESKDQQMNSMFDDVFFYKDVIEAILADKPISEQELAKRDNIAEDKRKYASKLLRKIQDLKQNEEKGNAVDKDLSIVMQQQLERMEVKIQMLQSQHAEDSLKNSDFEKKLEKKEAELIASQEEFQKTLVKHEKLANEFNRNVEQMNKLKEELNQMRRESDLFSSSLKKKEFDSGQLILDKENAIRESQSKKTEISQLKKSLNNQTEELTRLKAQLTKSRNLAKQFNTLKSQLSKVQSELDSTRTKLNQSQIILTQKQTKIRELQEQNDKNRSNGNKSTIINQQLLKSASVLLESAQKFNQIFGNSFSHSRIIKSSIDSFQQPALRQKEIIPIEDYLKRHLQSAPLAQLSKQLPPLRSAEILYRYPEDKSIAFSDKLKRRKNLLLVCRTENDAVLGAFSSVGLISPFKEDSKSSIFLFCAKEKTLQILTLKQGRKGVDDDEDFLILGNEELCIQRNCNYATSYFDGNNLKTLNFNGNHDTRVQFLTRAGLNTQNNQIKLKSYEIIQLSASK